MTTAHEHEHEPGHGHAADRGLRGMLGYARQLPRMWHSPVSDAVVAMIDPHDGERLVDIGAGMGPATVTAAKAGAIVVAVDPTPFMRRVLGLRRLWQRSRSHILITDGAAEALHIADATCDGLWAVNSMHHWTNVSIAIGEIHRVLRPGGRVVLVDESFDDPTHPWFARMQKRRAGHHRHFDDIDPTSFAALMSAAGFSSATGESGVVAGRPAKIVRATK